MSNTNTNTNSKVFNTMPVKTVDKELSNLLDIDPKKAITDMSVVYEQNVKSLDNALSVVNGLAVTGRDVWVHTSLIVYYALKQYKTTKLKAAAIAKLGDNLKYGKSQMYKFASAGEKLLKKEYDVIPLTLNEFTAKPKTDEKPLSVLTDIKKCGTVLSSDDKPIEHIIYRATKTSGKRSNMIYFLTPSKINLKNLQDIKEITISDNELGMSENAFQPYYEVVNPDNFDDVKIEAGEILDLTILTLKI